MLEPQHVPKFTASSATDRDLPPIPFDVEGVYAPGHSGPNGETTWTERFEACGVIPMAANASLTEAWVRDDATGRRQVNPGAVVSFLRDALPESEARRFMETVVYDKHRLVKLETLAEIVEYLGNRYTGRPTGAPASSSAGGAPAASGAAGAPSWPPSLP